MQKNLYAIILFFTVAFCANAQDIHFSQYYASPLTLNPALTGKFDGLYRINGIYRGQYFGVTGNPSMYRTPAASVDFSLFKDKMNGNALGIGGAIVNDQQAGVGKVNTTIASVSIAYTLNLDKKKTTQLGIGISPSYTFKKAGGDYKFGQAFDNNLHYDQSSTYNESVITTQQKYFNMSAGAFFNTRYKFMTFYMGYALMNIMRPSISFLNGGVAGKNQLQFRHVIHGGFEFDVTKKIVLIPGFLYQNMGKANEANAGVTLGYKLINDTEKDKKCTLFIGLWNRMGNDFNSAFAYRNITAKAGVEYQRFRAGFAYDIDVTKMRKDALSAGKQVPMAYELSLTYIGLGGKPLKENNYLFNPRY